jgi:rubrerythrin
MEHAPKINLKAAAEGEMFENIKLYPEFAAITESEGIPEISRTFNLISSVEKGHENRYGALLKNVEDGTVFKKCGKVIWRCCNCGYIHEGTEAPDECPACLHPRAYYEIFGKNY